ncbi:MAG: galactose oxidase [Actinomycetota bacterium]|nr:galactose oxidase [Actinomycetota bacterium]
MRRGLLAFALALLFAIAAVVTALAVDTQEDVARDGVGSTQTKRWKALKGAPSARTEVAAARIGRSIYVVGGFERSSGATVGTLERYDIRRNRWRRLRSLPVAVNHPTAISYRGRLYVHGGYRARRSLGSATARLWAYSPRRNRWSRLPASPSPRAAHALGIVGGRLYAAGGANERGSLRTMDVYSFSRRRWSRGPSFPGPARDHTTGAGTGGRFYVLAGRQGARGNFRVAESYDPRRRRWSRLPDMRRARGGLAAAVVRGRIVVVGGEDFTTGRTIERVEVYDPRRRRWADLPDMRTPRHGLGAAALGRRAYAVSGGPRPGFHFSRSIEFLDLR